MAFNLKNLERVGDFIGDPTSWRRWAFTFRGYVGAQSAEAVELIRAVEILQEPGILNDPDKKSIDNNLYFALAMCLQSAALDILTNVPEGDGLECWRRMAQRFEPRTAGHGRVQLIDIVEAKNLDGTFHAKVEQWEKKITVLEATTDHRVNDELRMAIFEAKIAPESVRRHLVLNSARLTTHQAMKEEIEMILLSHQAMGTNFDGPTAMDISQVTEENPTADVNYIAKKGGKYGGKNEGKHGGKGGKHDGKGYGGDHKGKDKPDTDKRFEGICNWCGRRGHRETDCVFKKGYDDKTTQPEPPRNHLGTEDQHRLLDCPRRRPRLTTRTRSPRMTRTALSSM